MSAIEEAENLFRTPNDTDGEVKRNRKNKKERQARRKLTLTKKGKEIVYSASPGRPPKDLT